MKVLVVHPIVLATVFFLAFLVLVTSGPGGRARAGAFLVGWMVPGAGQVVLGRWKKGLFFFAIIAATYGFGMWLVDFRAVSFDDNPFYYVGRFGCGAMMLAAQFLDRAYIPEDLDPSLYDPGLLYVCVAGLLNVVIMLNTLDIRRPGEEEPGEPAKSAETSPAVEETP